MHLLINRDSNGISAVAAASRLRVHYTHSKEHSRGVVFSFIAI